MQRGGSRGGGAEGGAEAEGVQRQRECSGRSTLLGLGATAQQQYHHGTTLLETEGQPSSKRTTQHNRSRAAAEQWHPVG